MSFAPVPEGKRPRDPGGIRQADIFWADMLKQVDWYREKAGAAVAEGYVNAVESTLQTLAKNPGLGRSRFPRWQELAGIRSWRIDRPYHRHLIFYRFDEEMLIAERVIHGARDLPVACFSYRSLFSKRPLRTGCSMAIGAASKPLLFCRTEVQTQNFSSMTLYHEILEAATVASLHPPDSVRELNEAGFEAAARQAQQTLGLASKIRPDFSLDYDVYP